jgi:hypothetical protein
MHNAKTGKHLVKSAKVIPCLRMVPQNPIIGFVLMKKLAMTVPVLWWWTTCGFIHRKSRRESLLPNETDSLTFLLNNAHPR